MKHLNLILMPRYDLHKQMWPISENISCFQRCGLESFVCFVCVWFKGGYFTSLLGETIHRKHSRAIPECFEGQILRNSRTHRFAALISVGILLHIIIYFQMICFHWLRLLRRTIFFFLQQEGYLVFSLYTNRNNAVAFAISRVPFLAAL